MSPMARSSTEPGADGGHGMIFKTFEEKLMRVLHKPNSGGRERGRLFELEDTGDLLRLAAD